MTDKFKVYAQTRATRQLAGDVAASIKLKYDHSPEDTKARKVKTAWQTIEGLLNDVECELERMDLK